jgi:general stress protein YciG
MSSPEPVSGVPVWARTHRKRGNPLVMVVLAPLSVLGLLTAGLAIHQKSFTGAGVRMDGWIASAHNQTTAAVGRLLGKPTKVAAPAAKVVTPETKVETPEAGEEAKDKTQVTQSGRKGGRYTDPTESSPVAESSAAR